MSVAPSDLICSAAAGRTSNPDTRAPSRRAVAMACRPATPAPMMKTLAGASVPAAVDSIGSSFGSAPAPRRTALYPLTVACEESTSIDCARVMRGTFSSASSLMPFCCSTARASACPAGAQYDTSAEPFGMALASAALTGWTLQVTVAPATVSANPEQIRAPAFSYCWLVNPAASPALASTLTVAPPFTSLATLSGTRPTRVSRAAVSLGTVMCMPKARARAQQQKGGCRLACRRGGGAARRGRGTPPGPRRRPEDPLARGSKSGSRPPRPARQPRLRRRW